MVTLLKRITSHARSGTLLRAIKFKLGLTPPAGDTYYGSKARDYDTRRASLPIWRAEQDAMQTLLEHIPSGSSVLDVPFGTGRFVPLYVARNLDISGLDGSPDMIQQAYTKYGDTLLGCDIRTGTATELPWADNTFDLTVCFRFLSHIVTFGEAKASIAEQARVTRSHAIVELGFRPRRRWFGAPPDGRRLGDQLTDSQVRGLLTKLGLSVIDAVYLSEGSAAQVGVYLCRKVSDHGSPSQPSV